MASRQPHLNPARHRDHRRRLIFASTLTAALMIEPSTDPLIRSRTPLPNSISTLSRAAAVDVAASGPDTTATGENLVTLRSRAHSCWRQRNKSAIEESSRCFISAGKNAKISS
jgi:hypothetical protein